MKKRLFLPPLFIFPYKIHVKIPGILHGKQVKIPGILAPGGDSTVALPSFCEKVVSAPPPAPKITLEVLQYQDVWVGTVQYSFTPLSSLRDESCSAHILVLNCTTREWERRSWSSLGWGTGYRRVLDKKIRLKRRTEFSFKNQTAALKRGPEATTEISQLNCKFILVYETKTAIVDRLDSVFRVWEFSQLKLVTFGGSKLIRPIFSVDHFF